MCVCVFVCVNDFFIGRKCVFDFIWSFEKGSFGGNTVNPKKYIIEQKCTITFNIFHKTLYRNADACKPNGSWVTFIKTREQTGSSKSGTAKEKPEACRRRDR